MILALEVDREVNLALFSDYLRRHGVVHRINEAGNLQQVWVEDDAARVLVRSLYQHFLEDANDFAPETAGTARPASPLWPRLNRLVCQTPVTIALLVLALLLFPVTQGLEEGRVSDAFYLMNYVKFRLVGDNVYFTDLATTLAAGQYWRLLAPMFLHFGVLHLVFNSLWVWEIGRRIERVCSSGMLLGLVLLGSLGSNYLQYALGDPSFFGGLSGVVFALLGFSLVWSKLRPGHDMGLPDGVYVFMLVFLVLGFSGLFDALGMGSLANWAHLGGLLVGLVFGGLVASIRR